MMPDSTILVADASALSAESAADDFDRIKAAGFDGVVVTLDGSAGLSVTDEPARFAALKRDANHAGLKIVALRAVDAPRLAAADRPERDAALRRVGALVPRAVAAGAGGVVVRPADLTGPVAPAYVDALAWTFDALDALRHDAEAAGVAIVVDHAGSRFLLSPAEAAELLDQVNSPAVGWQLDCEHVEQFGCVSDWIATMARHLMIVRTGAGRPERWRRRLARDLHAAGFAGPLVLDRPDDVHAWRSACTR